MMKKYEISEVLVKYHVIEVEDDVDIESVMLKACDILDECDSGIEALDEALSRCGRHEIYPEQCGHKITDLCCEYEL